MNKHLIFVRYVCATNTRAAHVVIQSGHFIADKRILPYTHSSAPNGGELAMEWLASNGYTIVCVAHAGIDDAIIVNEFISLADAAAGKRWKDGVVA